MTCKNCNNQIPDGSKFCTFCGTPVSQEPAVQPEAIEEKEFPKTEAVSQPEEQFCLCGEVPVSDDASVPPMPMVAPAPEAKEEKEFPKTEAVSSAKDNEPEESFPKTIAYNSPKKEKAAPESSNLIPAMPVPQSETAPEQPSAPEANGMIPAMPVNEAPEQPSAPAPMPAPQFDQFAPAPEQTEKPPKKKGKALPIILASVLAATGIFCLCFFCFRADIAHLFMGDAKYAKSIMNNAVDSLKSEDVPVSEIGAFNTKIMEIGRDGLPEGCEDYVKDMEEKYPDADMDFESAYTVATSLRMVGQALEAFKDKGISANAGVSIKLSDDMVDMILDGADDSDKKDFDEIIEYINASSIDAGFKADENSVQFLTGVNGAEGDFADMGFYYGKDGNAYITLKGLSDDAIGLTLPSFETIDEDFEFSEDDKEESNETAEELSKFASDMYEAFINSYDNAEITYESGEKKLGEIEFKGKVVTVKYDNEALSDLFSDLYDVADDSDAMTEMFGDDFAEGLKSASESVEEADDAEIIIEKYVSNTNRLLGMTITIADEDLEASLAFLASTKGITAEFKVEEEGSEDISCEFECLFTNKTDGVMNFKFPVPKYDYETNKSETTENTVTINYSNLKEVKVFEQKYVTGHYEITADFEYFDDEDEKIEIGQKETTVGELFEESSIVLDLSEKDGGISYTASFKNDLIGEFSVNSSAVPTNEDLIPTDYSSLTVINMFEDTETDKADDFALEVFDNLIAKLEGDKKLDEALTIGEESALDAIKEAKETFVAKKEFASKDFSGEWTTTKIDGLTAEAYAENLGLYSWEVASNLTFTADTITITNINGSKTYTYKKMDQYLELYDNDSPVYWLSYDTETDGFTYSDYNEMTQSYVEYVVEKGTQDVTMPEGFVDTRDKGKVLNIMCWNTELQGFMEKYYPGYENGKIGDVTVNWIIFPSDGGQYQEELDYRLVNQQYAYYDDDKIDLFLVEPDYIDKYIESDYVLPVSEIGIADEDTSNMYNYNLQLGTNDDGELKSVSYMSCPGVFAYRRSIAKEVLGTDNPEQVQAMLSNWNNFINIAKKLKDNGYYAILSYDQLLRPCLQEYEMPLVADDGTLTLSDGFANWISVCEELANYGCCKDYLANVWYYDETTGGDVFGVFFPTWGVNHTLEWMNPAAYGDWAICEGPAPYYWGGTFLCVPEGTDNPNLVADIMRKLTSVEEIGVDMATNPDILTFPNDKSAGQKAAEAGYAHDNFAGQNGNGVFNSVSEKINAASHTIYDTTLTDLITKAFAPYFAGTVTFEEAILNYYEAALKEYPELH